MWGGKNGGPRVAAERTTTQGTVKQSRRVTDVMVVYWYALTMRKLASTSAWQRIISFNKNIGQGLGAAAPFKISVNRGKILKKDLSCDLAT